MTRSRRAATLACGALLAAATGCGDGSDGADGPIGAVAMQASSAAAGSACARPYAADSPWNRPIGKVSGRPAGLTERLSSDPTQYTYPVYEVTRSTPLQIVHYEDWYSQVVDGGRRLINRRFQDAARRIAHVPVPPEAEAAAGSDAQVILIDRDTGAEWNMSHFDRDPDGGYRALNVGRYDTAWSAVPPLDGNGQPYFLRGAKIPYLAGLVRPCEIARGRIDHALAFAYPHPTPRWVYPATDSDGDTPVGEGLPEGTRLQLDPSLSADTLKSKWRCTGPCLTIARALQRYGMYLIDGGGRSKVMLEYEGTAHWGDAISRSTPSAIRVERIRIVPPPSRPRRR
jgi:hypothetical protein